MRSASVQDIINGTGPFNYAQTKIIKDNSKVDDMLKPKP